jgi:hypothetical protein
MTGYDLVQCVAEIDDLNHEVAGELLGGVGHLEVFGHTFENFEGARGWRSGLGGILGRLVSLLRFDVFLARRSLARTLLEIQCK